MGETPALDKFYRDHHNNTGILVIAIDQTAADVNAKIHDQGYYLPVLLDPNFAIGSSYGLQYIPTQVFVDSSGGIGSQQVGAMTAEAMWAEVQKLLPGVSYSVTAQVEGGHGQAAPATQNVSSGDSAAITIIPDPGYKIGGIALDGVLQPISNSAGEVFTIPNVTADHHLTVTFISEAAAFTDIASSPYRTAIEDLASRGVISGFPDGTFRPDDLVIRQQFAKMIVKTLGLPVGASDVCPFTDVATNVDQSDPLYPDKYVAVCAANHITQGKTPSTFAPYDNLTRAQLITMVARAAGLPDPPTDYSPPFPDFSPDHYSWARKAAHAGLLQGLQGMGEDYDFFIPASRGEVAQILHNLGTVSPAGPWEMSPGVAWALSGVGLW